MSVRTRSFDETKYLSSLIDDNELLVKYNKTWDKVSKIVLKNIDSKLVESEKYLKTKIKSHEGKINTIFHNGKIRD